MNQDTLLLLLTIFVSVSAIALVIQAGFLFGVYRSAKAMRERVSLFAPKAESFLVNAQRTLDESRASLSGVTTQASEIMALTHTQLKRVDGIMADAHDRARIQLDRLELVLDDTMGRVQSTVATVQAGVVKPIREINGVASGVRAALNHLIRAGRPSVAQATQDEEMFI